MNNTRVISTYWSDMEEGHYCEVKINSKEEHFYIKYYDSKGKCYHREDTEHINKSLRWCEDAAENWALGIKKLVKND